VPHKLACFDKCCGNLDSLVAALRPVNANSVTLLKSHYRDWCDTTHFDPTDGVRKLFGRDHLLSFKTLVRITA
jgi:hypothetical protein